MAKDVIAVFDVGKTNKKVLIYDRTMNVLERRYRHFESEVVDGVELEPLEAIQEWFLDTLKELSLEHHITSVGVTTHGATLVMLDEDGQVACPVVSYTHTPPEELHDQFYAAMGSRRELQERTATVELLPLINGAKLIYFTARRWPEKYARVRHLLFFPQYFAFLLTGVVTADYTYAGCHSYFWDYQGWKWDEKIITGLGLEGRMPEAPQPSWCVAGTVSPAMVDRSGLAEDVSVTVGIHDSNASLLPYLLKKGNEEFVLNSTGTWCVAMHPVPSRDGQRSEVSFAPEEIGKSVFFNISAFGDPVKTTILMGGLEFETYTKILKELHRTEDLPEFNRSLYQRILDQRQYFIIPGVVAGTGQFPGSRPRVIEGGREYPLEQIRSGAVVPPLFQDLPAAYAVLNLSIALQSRVALQRVGLRPGLALFTEGGFRHNFDYNALLAAFFPENQVFVTGIEEATSLGAAITALAAQEQKEPSAYRDLFEIETFPVKLESFRGLPEYEAAFLERV